MLNISPDERIRHWREFRKSLLSRAKTDHPKLVAEYWAKWPEINHFLDWDDCGNWEKPWDIIYRGDICPSSKALLMEQTLLMIGEIWSSEELELRLIKIPSQDFLGIILVINNEIVLNYSVSEVVNIDEILNSSVLLKRYKSTDNSHFELPDSP
jgi:hypothetical protein